MDRALVEKARKAAAEIFGGTSIFVAYAYGSRVSGRALPESDFDIGYYAKPPAPGMEDELRLETRLSALLGLEVDLRHLAEAPLELRGKVLEEGARIFSSDEPARVNLERDLLGRYHDYKSEFAELHRLRIESVARRGT